MIVTNHFRERCAQRISRDIDVDALAGEIGRAIEGGNDEFCRFQCRTDKETVLYRLRIVDRGTFYVLITRDLTKLITVVLPQGSVARGGKRKRKYLRGAVA